MPPWDLRGAWVQQVRMKGEGCPVGEGRPVPSLLYRVLADDFSPFQKSLASVAGGRALRCFFPAEFTFVHVCVSCVQSPWGQKRQQILWDDYELLRGCQEPNLGSLAQQTVLLTAEPISPFLCVYVSLMAIGKDGGLWSSPAGESRYMLGTQACDDTLAVPNTILSPPQLGSSAC